MYKISVNKELFKDILYKKITVLEKETSLYWKKELLQPIIKEDKIHYTIKQLDKISITNGLGEDKPQMVLECKKVDYSFKNDIFEFYLGRILEQKNTDIQEDYKDTLIEQLIREKALLEDKMQRDPLTDLFNRRKMETDLNIFVNRNNANILCAIFIDIDRFKGINDNFGHDMGDKVLIFLADKLKKHANLLNGEAYRFGGEEFIILCFIQKDELLEKINNLKEDIKSKKIYHPKKDISITVSMGVSFYKDSKSKEDLIKKADIEVYKAKKEGRDTIKFG